MTCTFLCAICTIKAQNIKLFTEADSLFSVQRYFEASVAYERILFSGSNEGDRYYAIIRKTQCLKQQRLFDQAINFLKPYLTETLPDSARYQLFTEQVVCAYLSGNYENAVSAIEQANIQFSSRKPDAKLLLIKVLSLNKLQQWNKAEKAYISFFNAGNDAANYENPYLKLPRLKSVNKAQWLSTFIPGAGQLYAGKPLEALVSIIIQGAGLYYGITSFLDHYYLSAWLAGAGLFGSFHMGGVRRSEVLVNQYNQKQADAFNRHVEELLLKEQRRH